MASSINASTSGAGGLITTADNTGILQLQSGGTTIATIDSTGLTMAAGKKVFSEGSVLQVVNATYSTYSTFSSSTYADTGLSASITPSSSSNKILVLVNIVGMGKFSSNTSIKLQLLRGSSSILVFEGIGPYNNATTSHYVGGTGTTYLDSPSTTSSTTYKVQIQSVANTSGVAINDTASGASGNSTITLMEIKG